jgi:hypothetical protein
MDYLSRLINLWKRYWWHLSYNNGNFGYFLFEKSLFLVPELVHLVQIGP